MNWLCIHIDLIIGYRMLRNYLNDLMSIRIALELAEKRKCYVNWKYFEK